jgi:hypothetical protein
MGVEAHDMPKLAYVARSAFDRASAAGDEDPFKYVVERILLVASNVPTHAAKYATVPKQVSDEAGLPPRPDHASGIVDRLARTIYGVEERARRPSPVLFDDLYAHTREEYRSAARAVLADLTAMGMDVLGGPLSGSDEMLETASDYAARAAATIWAKGWRAVIDGRNLNQKMYDAFQAGARWAYSQVAPIMAAKDTTIEETNGQFARWRAESQRPMPSRPTNWVAMLQKERDVAMSGRVDTLAKRELVDRQTETGEFVKPASTNEDGMPSIADPVARAEAVSFALRCRGIRASNIGARITTPCRRRNGKLPLC